MRSIQNISEAREAIHSGFLCLYPTETFYALGTSLLSEKIKNIFILKKRPFEKTLPCIAHSISQITEFASLLPLHRELFTLFPSLSIILPLKNKIPYFQDSIIFRLPSTPLLFTLTENTPIISTSANISGQNPVADYKNIDPLLIHSTDALIHPITKEDAPKGLAPSTIIYTKNSVLHIVREGTTSKEILLKHSFTVA